MRMIKLALIIVGMILTMQQVVKIKNDDTYLPRLLHMIIADTAAQEVE